MFKDRLMTVAQVAAKLSVEEATVTGWLRKGRIPGLKQGKFWKIVENKLEAWIIAGGISAHPEGKFSNTESIETAGKPSNQEEDLNTLTDVVDDDHPICTFSSYEVGKQVEKISFRCPLEWMPRIKRLVNKIPNFEGIISNFARHSFWWTMLIMEQRLRNGWADPIWEARKLAEIIVEEQRQHEDMVKAWMKAISAIRKIKNVGMRKDRLRRLAQAFKNLPCHLQERIHERFNTARSEVGMRRVPRSKENLKELETLALFEPEDADRDDEDLLSLTQQEDEEQYNEDTDD